MVIACAKDGVTVTGVIHEPSTGETFYGAKGGGAFLNGKPIKASASTSLGDGSLGVGFANRRETENVPGLIKDLLDRGGIFFRNASGALMLAYVASGPVDRLCRAAHEFLGLHRRPAAHRGSRWHHRRAGPEDRACGRNQGLSPAGRVCSRAIATPCQGLRGLTSRQSRQRPASTDLDYAESRAVR